MSMLREYGKLSRVHSAVLTGLTPVLGAIAVGGVELTTLIILFLTGLCTHIFGFVFNEFMDVEIDRHSKLLKDKPLVKGTISKPAALAFACSGVILGYLFTGYLMLTQESMTLLVIIFYTLSWLAIGVYDLTSKSVCCSDLALAIWTGALCLFGGFALTDKPTYLLYIIAGLAFFQLVIQNILAGLKDLPQDQLGSGTTTPLRMGVKLSRKRLKVPPRFQGYIYSLKIVHLSLVFAPFILLWIQANLLQISFIFCLIIFNFILVFYIFNAPKFNRENLLRAIGLHEIISYSIVPVMFIGIISVQSAIFLIIFPIVWLAVAMRLIYGRLLPLI